MVEVVKREVVEAARPRVEGTTTQLAVRRVRLTVGLSSRVTVAKISPRIAESRRRERQGKSKSQRCPAGSTEQRVDVASGGVAQRESSESRREEVAEKKVAEKKVAKSHVV